MLLWHFLAHGKGKLHHFGPLSLQSIAWLKATINTVDFGSVGQVPEVGVDVGEVSGFAE